MQGSKATNPVFVGLDIGTSAVRCIVGMLNPDEGSGPSIIGHGSSINTGMRRGIVVHPEEVADAIHQAVTEAERISGVTIKSATVNINGSHVSGLDSQGVIAISAADREIGSEDRLRVEEAAAIVHLPPNREIIQVFAKNYSVDGQGNIKDPVGMHGVRLEVDTHIVTASSPHTRSLDMALEKASLQAGHRTVGSLAAAEAVLNRQQKESGTLLIDIGAGTTNLLVVEDGEVEHVAVIPMGGIHITNDLAIGLKTDLEIAEAVKLKHGSTSGKTQKAEISVEHNQQTHAFDSEEVSMIVEARVDEILDHINAQLAKIKRTRKLPGGVVIVGGSAKLRGLTELTREKVELAARLGSVQGVTGLVDTVEDSSYITAIGLMLLDMLLSQHQSGFDISQATEGLFGLVTGIVRKLRRKK